KTDPITYNSSTGAIGLGYNSTNLQLTTNQLNTIQNIATNSTPTFAGIITTGNIGLGTATTIEKLHVSGNIHQSGVSDSIGGAGYMLGSDTSRNWVLRNSATSNNLNLDYYSGSWKTALTVLNSTGNVGIGTTNPTQKLDINGIVNSTGIYVNGSPYQSSQWTTTGSDIYYTTGNVGIGTATTIEKLQVSGNIHQTAASDSQGGAGYMLGADNSRNWVLRRTTTGNNLSLDYYTGSAWGTAFTVLNLTGNVGIGTNNPGALFSVGADAFKVTSAGTVTAGAWNATTIAAANGGTGQTSYTIGDILYASSTTALSKLADIATGNVLLSGGVGAAPSWGKVALGTHTTGNYAATLAGTANQLAASASTGDITLSIPNDFRAPGTVNAITGINTGADAGTQRIDASGNLANIGNLTLSGAISGGTTYSGSGNITSTAGVLTVSGAGSSTIAGNVGIGNTVPLGPLHVGTTGTPTLFVAASGNVGVGLTNPAYKLQVNGDLRATTIYGSIAEGGGAAGWVDDGTVIRLQTSTDNIGIGWTSPLEKLHLAGNILQTSSSDSVGTAGFMLGSDTQRYWVLRRTTTGNNLALDYYNTSSVWNNLLTILDSSGNIGIGTLAPASKLELFGSGAGTGFLLRLRDSGGLDKVSFLDNGNLGIGTTSPLNKLDVGGSVAIGSYAGLTQSPANGLAVSGNIGIGTATAIDKIHLAGSALQSSASDSVGGAGYFLGSDTQRYWAFRRTTTGNNLALDYYTGSVWNNALTALSSNGNVGIGTIAPAQKLEVSGAIKTTNLTIGTLSGVLKASSGAVAGSATTDELDQGSTN
ncbi:MAG: hypothetical protein HY966_04990, partial [Ignavibacteriales bacterium]|nr:hypothetical protein [Ignavibacteriales bacterium]